MSEIDKLEEIAKAATPGPWFAGEARARGQEVGINTNAADARLSYTKWEGLAVVYGCDDQPKEGAQVARANATHIATFSPERVLALLAVVRASRELDALIESGVGPVSRESASLHCALAAFDALEKP